MQKSAGWLDFIKVFGVLATLFLHTNSRLANFQTSIVDYHVDFNLIYWKISAVFASLAGPSFALIFMYVGAVILSSKNSSIIFFLSKIKNLIIPLIFWSIFAIIFQKYIMHWDIDIWQELSLIPIKAAGNNLWLLYFLISVFLITPILKRFINHSTAKEQIYLLFLWIITVSLPPFISKNFHLSITSFMPMMGGYVGYMLLGYMLAKTHLTKILLIGGFLLFIGSNTWIVWGLYTYYQPSLNGTIVAGEHYYINRFALPMLLNSIGSFILLRYIGERFMQKKYFFYIITALSSMGLGICMVYEYWRMILATEKIGIELTAFSGNPLWSVPLTTFFIILGSYVTVYIIKKIPYLRHTTPKLI